MNQILIIEDDTDINNLMAKALTEAGYSCMQGHFDWNSKL